MNACKGTLRWFVVITLLLIVKQQAVGQPDGEHGTCAITLATSDAIAVIVDSKLTRAGSSNSCVEAHHEGCKSVLIRKNILLVVTGAFNDPVDGVDWKVSNETQKLLTNLPKTFGVSDLNQFSEQWFHVLVRHYRSKRKLDIDPGRAVSTLIIATRIEGKPFSLKIDVSFQSDQKFHMDVSALKVQSVPQLSYAGSCHDNINSWATGSFVPAADPPDPIYLGELRDLGLQAQSATTAAQFVPLLKNYEDLFARIGNSENRCWIGPPYDVATWESGADGWTTNFKKACNPQPSITVKGTNHSRATRNR